MPISDLTAYSDNARPFWGKRPAEPPRGPAARSTRPCPSEKAAGEPEYDFLSSGIYKGNYIDIYV